MKAGKKMYLEEERLPLQYVLMASSQGGVRTRDLLV